MTRPVSSPRQMALRQTLQRNVFHKPIAGAPKRPAKGPGPEPGSGTAEPLPEGPKAAPASAAARVGRNDPCPCGSGKKSKKCCG